MTSIIVQPGATEASYQITVEINDVTYEVGATFGVGPRGPAGVNMTGPWAADTAYVVDDGVYRNGSSYWARQASTGVDPETDVDADTGLGTYWNLMAAEGKPGDVQGPATSTVGHLAVWGDTAGSALTDGGAPLTLGTTSTTALAGDTTAADLGALPDTATAADVGAVANATGQTLTLWTGTAAAYAAIGTKDSNTVYVVTA